MWPRPSHGFCVSTVHADGTLAKAALVRLSLTRVAPWCGRAHTFYPPAVKRITLLSTQLCWWGFRAPSTMVPRDCSSKVIATWCWLRCAGRSAATTDGSGACEVKCEQSWLDLTGTNCGISTGTPMPTPTVLLTVHLTSDAPPSSVDLILASWIAALPWLSLRRLLYR